MFKPMIAALLAAGPVSAAASLAPEPPPVFEIKAPNGRVVARVMVFEAEGFVQVRVQAAGLAQGRYGVHVHDKGLCEAPSFESAGLHWNPLGRQHGHENANGPHLGDLPNLTVDAQGGRLEFGIEGGHLFGGENPLFDADGAAIVIHAEPDDYRTDPSGNSGARIGCGALVR